MTPPSVSNVLIVTGGTSGIGAALVNYGRSTLGYDVIFTGSRPVEEVPFYLNPTKNGTHYVQADVSDPVQMRKLGEKAQEVIGGRSIRLLTVASAGVSLRGSDDAVARMRDINVGGTRNLRALFAELSASEDDLFVGVGSIVAAEGIAVKGDEAYQETKRAIHQLTQRVQHDYTDVLGQGLTLMPGAVDTPMTRKELIFAMLLLGAVTSTGTSPLHAGLLQAGGFQIGQSITPSELLIGLLNLDGELKDKVFADPGLTRRGKVAVLAQARREPSIINRAADILHRLDVVITPDLVAQRVFEAFEAEPRVLPEDGMLKVYSQGDQKPILHLMNSLGG